MKKVEWSHAALKTLKRIDRTLAARIVRAVERFAKEGIGDVKKLQGSDEYRLRVGDWRVRFLNEPTAIVVLAIKPRGGAYS